MNIFLLGVLSVVIAFLFFPAGLWLTRLATLFVEQEHRRPKVFANEWRRLVLTKKADAYFSTSFFITLSIALSQAQLDSREWRVVLAESVLFVALLVGYLVWQWFAYKLTIPHGYFVFLLGLRLVMLFVAAYLMVIGKMDGLYVIPLIAYAACWAALFLEAWRANRKALVERYRRAPVGN